MKKVLFYVFLGLFFISCGKEKLTPVHQSITFNELKNNKPTLFSYHINDTQIDEYGKDVGQVPLFGKLFKAIAIMLANGSILNSGGRELELDTVDVDLSDLTMIDFELVDYIKFDALNLSIKNPNIQDTLSFIDKLEVYAKFDIPVPGLAIDAAGFSKVVYYEKTRKILDCDKLCINFNIANIDWREIFKTNKIVHLKPKLIINSVPLSTMKLAGTIDFSVKFNLGF